jgi:hypothetical protein
MGMKTLNIILPYGQRMHKGILQYNIYNKCDAFSVKLAGPVCQTDTFLFCYYDIN